MAFTTIEELYETVCAVLKRLGLTVDADAPQWRVHTKNGREAAYNEIVSALALRGYTAAQIAGWDRGKEFELAIGTFWALDYGGCLGNYDDRMVTKLDRREELKTVAVLVDGVIQNQQTKVGHGKLKTTDDLFVLDPDDCRRGQPTRW